MNLDRDRIIYLFIAWISIVLWVTIRNCQKDFVPVVVPPDRASTSVAHTEAKSGTPESQQGTLLAPVCDDGTAAAGTSLWLHATTNINEPLVEFPMSTNDIAILQQIAPEAIGWDGLTQQQKLDSW